MDESLILDLDRILSTSGSTAMVTADHVDANSNWTMTLTLQRRYNGASPSNVYILEGVKWPNAGWSYAKLIREVYRACEFVPLLKKRITLRFTFYNYTPLVHVEEL